MLDTLSKNTVIKLGEMFEVQTTNVYLAARELCKSSIFSVNIIDMRDVASRLGISVCDVKDSLDELDETPLITGAGLDSGLYEISFNDHHLKTVLFN